MATVAEKRKEAALSEEERLAHFHQTLVAELKDVHSYQELLAHAAYAPHADRLNATLSTPEIITPSVAPLVSSSPALRAVAWNVERGLHYARTLSILQNHPQMKSGDIFLLSEVDFGMARSGNRHVARDLCHDLGLHGVFGPAFLNLDKGNGAEGLLSGVNSVALQGHAILSRFPIESAEVIPLPNGKDPMAGKERQIGREQALVARLKTPNGRLTVVCIHLSAHSSPQQRVNQMKAVLEKLAERKGPILLGGDWNTSTYSAHHPIHAILGFWRRVLMGVHYVMRNHYPFPERYFERKFFHTLKQHGFPIEGFNVPGACTLHYDFSDPFTRLSLSDWIPQWCFPFLEWVLKPHNGRCSFKLDWFAGKDLEPTEASVVTDLPRGEERASDHDPIVAEVQI